MTATQEIPPTPPPAVSAATAAKPEKFYGFSVLITGIARFFRAFVPLILVIVVNALVQALLTIPDYTVGFSAGFIATVIVSFVVLVWSFGLLNAAALNAATPGRVSIGSTFATLGAHFWLFVLWAVIEYLLVMAGLIVYTYGAFVVLLVTPFVTVAAMDGQKVAIVANFRAIGGRPIRWIFTTLILGIILVVSYLLTAVNGFFINGFLGSIITWVYWGILASWVLASYAALYRSTAVGAPVERAPEPEFEPLLPPLK
ncbi:MAG: hypothetical protein WCP28_05305 [Actinomycetes bacterium]